MKYVYPALFEPDSDDSELINVTFPDIIGGATFGRGKGDALAMAKDLLRVMLTDAPAQCYEPKNLEETKKDFPGAEIIMVEVEI